MAKADNMGVKLGRVSKQLGFWPPSHPKGATRDWGVTPKVHERKKIHQIDAPSKDNVAKHQFFSLTLTIISISKRRII
jgi:hypothetical protein